MAENVVLNNLANLQNDTTTINTINGNNATITAAFSDVLSRTGVSPNQMGSPLDMNNWPIMNLPAPGSANSPARLVDVTSTNPITISLSLQGDVTAPASSGVLTSTVGKVNGVTYPASPSTNTVPVVTGSNTVAYQTVGASQFRQSAGLSVVGNGGTSTANVADITGTTRQVLTVNTAGTGLVFAQPRGDQLLGSATNDTATAGNVGEYVSSSVVSGSGVSLTTATPANVTSISLTAGDWDISALISFTSGTGTVLANALGSISQTSATLNTTPGFFCKSDYGSPGITVTNAATVHSASLPSIRVSLATTTTFFAVAQAGFTTSTLTAFGTIQARRVR